MAHSSILTGVFSAGLSAERLPNTNGSHPSPDSRKKQVSGFNACQMSWTSSFSFKGWREPSNGPIWRFWTLATSYLQILRSLITICWSASLTLTKRSWFCSSPVWHPNPTCETTLPKSSAQFHFVVKIYLGLLAAEHQCRVAAFDFAWWQSQFSDVFGCPGLMLSRACHV